MLQIVEVTQTHHAGGLGGKRDGRRVGHDRDTTRFHAGSTGTHRCGLSDTPYTNRMDASGLLCQHKLRRVWSGGALLY